jgi:hypothetical protein
MFCVIGHNAYNFQAARVIYDDQQNATAALAAKHELSQIFTKTLTIQVWRPEFERPGRHFVYTTRYVYFFVGLLDQLDDRASLDQLLRRVRKKQGDFLNHTKLWEDICLTYAKVKDYNIQLRISSLLTIPPDHPPRRQHNRRP